MNAVILYQEMEINQIKMKSGNKKRTSEGGYFVNYYPK